MIQIPQKSFIHCYLFYWVVNQNIWISYFSDNTLQLKYHWLVSTLSNLYSNNSHSQMDFLFQSTTNSEKQLKFSPEQKDIDAALKEVPDQQQKDAIKNILLRNRALRLLHALLFTNRNTVNNHLSDDISRILGLDWLLLLMQPQIHSSTVILGKMNYCKKYHSFHSLRSINLNFNRFTIYRHANSGGCLCK